MSNDWTPPSMVASNTMQQPAMTQSTQASKSIPSKKASQPKKRGIGKLIACAAVAVGGFIALRSFKDSTSDAAGAAEASQQPNASDIDGGSKTQDVVSNAVPGKTTSSNKAPARGEKWVDENGNELMAVPKPKGRKKKASPKQAVKSATSSLQATQEAEKATTAKS